MDVSSQIAFEQLQTEHEKALKDVESYKAVMEEQRDEHKKEIRKLYAEINELKEQLALDNRAFSLLNVLRNNGDTIVVAEREAKVITEIIKDLNDRSETLHLHLSSIAKDICQTMDDVQYGMNKRNEQLETSPKVQQEDNSDQSQISVRPGDRLHLNIQLFPDENSALFRSYGDSANLDTSPRANSTHAITARSHADSNHLVNVFREEAGLVSFFAH